jgi:hypothetical protein
MGSEKFEDTKGAIRSRKSKKVTDNTIAKSLKIPKVQSEVVNRRRSDNTIAKSLKIPKVQSEVVIRRRKDNTMAKREKGNLAQRLLLERYG